MNRRIEGAICAAMIIGVVACSGPRQTFDLNEPQKTECRGKLPFDTIQKEASAAARMGATKTPEDGDFVATNENVKFVIAAFNEASCGGLLFDQRKKNDTVVPCNRSMTVEQLRGELSEAKHFIHRGETVREALTAYRNASCPDENKPR